MSRLSDSARKTLRRLDELLQEDPREPIYDPVHLGAAVAITMAALGCLYWLLWTLLVYEGGIFLKIRALARLLFTPTTLKDLGYEGMPYAMGAFEGWVGNVGALVFAIAFVWALRNLYRRAQSRAR